MTPADRNRLQRAISRLEAAAVAHAGAVDHLWTSDRRRVLFLDLKRARAYLREVVASIAEGRDCLQLDQVEVTDDGNQTVG